AFTGLACLSFNLNEHSASLHPVNSELLKAKQSLYSEINLSNGSVSSFVLTASPNFNPKSPNTLSSGLLSSGAMILSGTLSTIAPSTTSTISFFSSTPSSLTFPSDCIALITAQIGPCLFKYTGHLDSFFTTTFIGPEPTTPKPG